MLDRADLESTSNVTMHTPLPKRVDAVEKGVEERSEQ
jgi:hypothetical protein